MLRLLIYFLIVGLVAGGLTWLADQPGTLVVHWLGLEIETSVFAAVVMLLMLVALVVAAWALVRSILWSPAALSQFVSRKRQQQGFSAVSAGMIAAGSGDRALASRFAQQASRSLPNEPLTALLRAQVAELAGDRGTVRRIYEAMTLSPETELLGLRGLYLEAERENETLAARQFAERAMKCNPKSHWAGRALFDLQCKDGDFGAALETLGALRRHDHVDRKTADRWRAVLLTGQAAAMEDRDIDKAQALALEAHDLAPDLVPAAEIAGRALASRGKMAKAASVIEQTWKRSPHPDLAVVYAHARTGDSPRDRLQRVQRLAALVPGHRESRMALAAAAIEAHEWALARQTIEPMTETDLSQRVCVLMARIEGGERGDTGRVREWLARAVHAPRDAAWAADGHVSERWAAVSPVTGKLDAYRWVVTPDHRHKESSTLLLEELSALVRGPDRVIEVKAIESDGEAGERDPQHSQQRIVEPAAASARSAVDPQAEPAHAVATATPALAAPERSAEAEAVAGRTRPSPVVEPVGPARERSLAGRDAAAAATPADAGEATMGRQGPPRYFTPSHAPDDPGPDSSDIALVPAR